MRYADMLSSVPVPQCAGYGILPNGRSVSLHR